jgi:ABC-type uncharacterized transport system ATPase subunit
MADRPMLEARGVTKRFGGVQAVRGIDFKLQEGELRCIIGPNGAGKSTFFKLLTGQLRPDGGRILFRGQDITGAETSAIARFGIGMAMQVPSVFDGLDVRENLRMGARRRHRERAAQRRVDLTLETVGLTAIAGRLVGHLAHGQRALVELATVLAAEPELLLLDEPTAGMTRGEVERTAQIIREIARTSALVVVEHDMNFIRMIGSRVTVFHQGATLIEGTVQEVLRNPMVRDVYLGRQAEA